MGTVCIMIIILLVTIGNIFPEEPAESEWNTQFAVPMLRDGIIALIITVIIYYFCG